METKRYMVPEEAEGMRIDKFLCEQISGFSRQKLKETFERRQVTINEASVKPSRKVCRNEEICIILPEVEKCEVVAQNIPITIVYEDSDLVIVDKPQGMVVHPAPGNYDGTLVNALMYHVKDLSDINGIIRPGIVHRIDKDTSGLLVVAKNNTSHNFLAEQFAVHSITRSYMAVVHGIFKEKTATIDAPIGRDKQNRLKMCVTDTNSKKAITNMNVIKLYENYSHVKLSLQTGRTHQIRVHMSYIAHPVIGDPLYGKHTEIDRMFDGQLLHACELGFIHPTSREYVHFESPLPSYFYKLL